MSERMLLPVISGDRLVAVLRDLLHPHPHRLRALLALTALVGGAASALLTAPLLGGSSTSSRADRVPTRSRRPCSRSWRSPWRRACSPSSA